MYKYALACLKAEMNPKVYTVSMKCNIVNVTRELIVTDEINKDVHIEK